jgi:protein-tyrosine phosphatase
MAHALPSGERTPERIPLADEPPSKALVARVRAALAGGGIVAMPTETVYGLAARADRAEALRGLAELKQRGDGPLTWHVGTRDAVELFLPLRPLARRLARRYWPGPLTLVLRGVPPGLELVARDGWTGLRLPAHRGTAGILAALDFPVVLSSANRHAEPPCTSAEPVVELFGPSLELVLDGGAARLGESSGVLRLGPGRFELLREGLLRKDELRAAAGLGIGFVCTGNTCRSPLAEVLAAELLAQRLGVTATPAEGLAERLSRFGFAVVSMGLSAATGSPAAQHAVEVARERGLDLTRHASRPARLEDLLELDRIYCLTRAHLEALSQLLPPSRAPALFLLDPAGEDVPDPIGGSRDDYRRSAERIRAALGERAADWA